MTHPPEPPEEAQGPGAQLLQLLSHAVLAGHTWEVPEHHGGACVMAWVNAHWEVTWLHPCGHDHLQLLELVKHEAVGIAVDVHLACHCED